MTIWTADSLSSDATEMYSGKSKSLEASTRSTRGGPGVAAIDRLATLALGRGGGGIGVAAAGAVGIASRAAGRPPWFAWPSHQPRKRAVERTTTAVNGRYDQRGALCAATGVP